MTLRQAQSYTRPYRNPSTSRCGAGLALVPANLLPYKKHWQEIANGLPKAGVLIILPPRGKPLHKTLETVATLLEADGHPVTTLPARGFANLVKPPNLPPRWANHKSLVSICYTKAHTL